MEQSPAKGKSKVRNRSKSVHVPSTFSKENDENHESASEDDELEIPDLDHSVGGSEDIDSDGWSSGDEQELVKNIRQFTNKSDKLRYTTRVQRLDWKKIAFKKHTPEECQERFTKYLKMVRNYRTLHEVLYDLEEEIKRIPFKKPLNSYQLFVQDQLSKVQSSGDFSEKMRNLATSYKNLSATEREKYNKKAKLAFDEYNRMKMEYMAVKDPGNLKSPYFLFCEYWKQKDGKLNATQLKNKYDDMSQNDKYKWVEKAVKANPGISITSFLSKDEQRLYRGLPKSVGTPYSMYVKDMYAQVKGSKEEGGNVFAEIAQKWNNLPAAEKEKYKKACAKLRQEALTETQAINEKFGVQVTKMTRNKTKKTSKMVIESDDEDHVEPPPPKEESAKKRRMSMFEPSETKNTTKRKKNDQSTVMEFVSPAPVTSTPFIKSKKRSDTVSSEDVADEQMSPRKYMVQIPTSELNDVQSDTSTEWKKKKKKNKNKTKDADHDSGAEASTSSSVSGEKKKKKKDLSSPRKNVNTSSHDSDANDSEPKKKLHPPEARPPSTLLEFFQENVYTGKPHKVQKAFDKLTNKELKELTAQHNEKVEIYVNELKDYLSSLPKKEAVVFVNKMRAQESLMARSASAAAED